MTSRYLGQLRTEVFSLGIGAMSFSDFYGKATAEDSHNILSTAMELGVNHIDTSDIYGKGVSEERIGQFLVTNSEAKKFFKIATKGGIETDSSGNNRFNNSKEYLTSALESSLKRLGVEQVELYYVHRREADRPIEEVTEILKSFVEAGKVRQIGFSEISPNSLTAASKIHPVAAVQSEYSLSTRYPELGLLQRCKALDTSLVAFSPVGRSLLTDKPHTLEKATTMPFLQQNPRFLPPNLENNIRATEKFRSLAADFNITAGGLAIAWLVSKGDHILPIPGTRSVKHFRAMVEGSLLCLTKSDLEAIESVLPVGWAFGDRYSSKQWIGPEKYC